MPLNFGNLFTNTVNFFPSGQWDADRKQTQIFHSARTDGTSYITFYTVPAGKKFWLTKVSVREFGGQACIVYLANSGTEIDAIPVSGNSNNSASYSPALLFTEGQTVQLKDDDSSNPPQTEAFIFGIEDPKGN